MRRIRASYTSDVNTYCTRLRVIAKRKRISLRRKPDLQLPILLANLRASVRMSFQLPVWEFLRMSRRNRHARGVTLIELIVGVLLLAVVLTLLLPFIDRVRGRARSGAAVNNIRRMGEGIRVYHDVYQSFPMQPKDKTKDKDK